MIKNLYELYNLIEKVSTALPNVNCFANAFDSLNREDTSYAAVVLQFRDGTQATEGSVRYRFYLGYVDRVNENTDTPSTSNNILTQSIAEENIRLIINKLYPEVDITFGNTFYPFTQRFTALTAGCYVELSITLAVKDCNYESGSVLRDVEIVSDSNGVKEVVPGSGVDGFKKVIVRTEVPLKTEIEKDIVITENGNTTYTPDEGESFVEVNVSVNVPPVDIAAPYRIKQPVADYVGLKSLGWTDEDINYFQYNNFAYEWEMNDYKVSEENKKLIVDYNTKRKYKDNPDFKYCNRFDITGDAEELFINCKYLTAIPKFDTSQATTFYNAFNDCENLLFVPMLDTSKATRFDSMFAGDTLINNIPRFDTSNAISLGGMFRNCISLVSIPMMNTSKVIDMSQFVYGCSALERFPMLDTSKTTNMSGMFSGCSKIKSIPMLDTSKATNMSDMFDRCSALTTIPMLDTSNVTDMSTMFYDMFALIEMPRLNATNLANTTDMFSASYKLNYEYPSFTTFGGLTGLKVDLDLSCCPKLTKESLLNVFNEAADVTSSPKTLTIGDTNLNKLSDEEKAIATNKGWVLK